MPPHARAGGIGRGHRFAAYPRCSADRGVARVRRLVLMLCGIAVAIYGPMVLIHAFCITGLGGWAIPGVELFIFVPVGCLGLTVLALVCLPFRAVRRAASVTLLSALVMVILFIPALGLATAARRYGFKLAAQRARPLVAAIARFERERGQPPESLAALVPTYLPELPRRIPQVRLITGPETPKDFAGNAWVLRAMVPSGVINFDQFMYFPNQQYPEFGYGGGVERIADWAYVHE
jgi:hypothetical protein